MCGVFICLLLLQCFTSVFVPLQWVLTSVSLVIGVRTPICVCTSLHHDIMTRSFVLRGIVPF